MCLSCPLERFGVRTNSSDDLAESGPALRARRGRLSGTGEVGGFSAFRVVVLADSPAAWPLWPLASSGWVNCVPVDLASLSGSVMAWVASEHGALSDFKGCNLQRESGLPCLIARVEPHVTGTDR
jgi:hypothetical protein